MPPPPRRVRADPRIPDADPDDDTFGLGGLGDPEPDDGRAADPATWTRLDGRAPGCVIYPHGYTVRYQLDLPLADRLEALAEIGWSEGDSSNWRRVGRRQVMRGSVYLTQRAPRSRGRARHTAMSRFNSGRGTVFYALAVEHTNEATHIELHGVRWPDVAKFFERALHVNAGAARQEYFLTLERFIVLRPDQAFALAERLGFVASGGRGSYSRKGYLIEKVEIPVKIRSRATSKVVLSLYRIDRGATADFKLEVRLRGRRRDAKHFYAEDARVLDDILLALVEGENLNTLLKPARWEPRDRRSISDSAGVDDSIRGLAAKAWRGALMTEALLRDCSDLHIPRRREERSAAGNMAAAQRFARLIRTSPRQRWLPLPGSSPTDVRCYMPEGDTSAPPRPGHSGRGGGPEATLAREIVAIGAGVIEVVLPEDVDPERFIRAMIAERGDRRVGVGVLGTNTWPGVEAVSETHPLTPECEDVVVVVDPSVAACAVGRGFERAARRNRHAPEVLSTSATLWSFLREARVTCERNGALLVLFTVDDRTQAAMDGTAGNGRFTDALVRSFAGDATRYWCHQRYRVDMRRSGIDQVVTLRDDAEGLVGRLVWPGAR